MTRKKNQRGFVLITALVLSILYFALMELLLIDSSRALNEAQRFRAHVVAGALAESAAELAAFQIVPGNGPPMIDKQDSQGTMHGVLERNGNSFVLHGDGVAIGVMTQAAKVRVEGRVEGVAVKIDFTVHGE
jgi:type II secretory pathway pseudopilin PulG